MFVEPLPGVDLERLRMALAEVAMHLLNARGRSGGPDAAYLAYAEWVDLAITRLTSEVSPEEIERLVLTRRSWAIQTINPAGEALDVVRRLVNAEIADRVKAFDAAMAAVAAENQRWLHAGVLVMPDTSFYIEHSEKLEDVDFRRLLPIRDQPVRIILPMLVIDELDGQKRSGQHKGWRAAYTLALLDRLRASDHPVVLEPEALSDLADRRGAVTVEILFDPPRHTRLAIADDEIIARGLVAQNRRGRPLTLLTYDTGQASRGRLAGLEVNKLSHDLGAEPPPQKRR